MNSENPVRRIYTYFSEKFSQAEATAGLVFFLMGIVAVVLMFRAAWVSDDAYITFRTIDNFCNGLGMRWNVAERVQSFTHPLWMLLLSCFYYVTREAFLTSILLSIALSAVALLILIRQSRLSAYSLFPVLTLLISSKAFIDYSTSGLENGLSYALLAAFSYCYFYRTDKPKNLGLLSLIAALAALNRLDTILLYGPALLMATWQCRKSYQASLSVLLKYGFLGFLPLIAWTLFSIVYYGFPFPNTAYAKLNTGIDAWDYFLQGISYFLDSLMNDTVTLTGILTALGFTFYYRKRKERVFAIGLILYLLYILRIGGDFMSGRFFSVPVLAAAILISRIRIQGIPALLIAGILGIVGLSVHRPTLKYGRDYRPVMYDITVSGIMDERGVYYGCSGLVGTNRYVMEPSCPMVALGKTVRAAGDTLVVEGSLGYFGYYAGPEAHVVDYLALSDPLLARIPAKSKKLWRIGHFVREIPAGYLESLQSGQNELENPEYQELYESVRLITREPIWTRERWKAIWQLN